MQIKDANHARTVLRRRSKQKGRKKAYNHIRDDRLVKKPVFPFGIFVTDRFSTGDMKGMLVTESARLIASEWKALPAAEKKVRELTHSFMNGTADCVRRGIKISMTRTGADTLKSTRPSMVLRPQRRERNAPPANPTSVESIGLWPARTDPFSARRVH